MAHEVYQMADGRQSMAYVGETPWHGLGQHLTEDADIDTWKVESGLNWRLKESQALYFDPDVEGGSICEVPDRKVLVRDDTNAPLATVSDKYRVVQPDEVLEFYRDVVSQAGFKLDTAGSLVGGRKYWALAKIGKEARLLGQDAIEGYLLLATSCDGSLATTAMFTSVRVVCANTLGFAINRGEQGKEAKYLKIPHLATFDAEKVKADLGLAAQSWDSFIERTTHLAKRKVHPRQAVEYLVRVFSDLEDDDEVTDEVIEELSSVRIVRDVHQLFSGAGRGSDLKSAKGTAWGLVNSVTEYLDHHRATRTADSRLNRSWFGDGALIKSRAWDEAMKLAA